MISETFIYDFWNFHQNQLIIIINVNKALKQFHETAITHFSPPLTAIFLFIQIYYIFSWIIFFCGEDQVQ